MGANYTNDRNQDFFEDLKRESSESITDAKFTFDKQLDLEKRLGMVSFEVKIDSGEWNLSKIIEYLTKLKTDLK